LAIGLEVSRRYALALTHPGCAGPQRTPADVGLSGYREVAFSPKGDGLRSPGDLTLKAWWVPSRNRAAVILIPGIGQARDGMLDQGAMLARHGYGVLLTDPRPCASPDVVFTAGYAEVSDVAGALAFVQAQPDVDPDRIGVLGFSVGGATAILSAAQLGDIRAVASEGNFYNLGDDIAGGHGSPLETFYQQAILFFYRRQTGIDARLISPIDAIGQISPRPVLLIFGEYEVASGRAAEQLAAAGEPKALWIVPGVGHGGYIQTRPDEYEARVIRFFDEALLDKADGRRQTVDGDGRAFLVRVVSPGLPDTPLR
jgi:dipeptidyl aminopeptidase/acylaminoacyl peptidase